MSLNIVKGFEPRSSAGLECIRTVLQSFDMKAEPLGTPHWNSRKVCLDRLTQGPNRHGLLYFNAGIMYFICLFLWTFLVGVRINEGFCLVFFYTRTLQSNHCTGADLPVSGFLFKGTLFGILFFWIMMPAADTKALTNYHVRNGHAQYSLLFPRQCHKSSLNH